MKLSELIKRTVTRLELAGFNNSKLDAELIISHFTEIKRLELNLHANEQIDRDIQTTIEQAVQRRLSHEPIQYILGETEFYGYKILVNNSVLIPRPETEFLVEKIIDAEKNIKSILEIGTGSGCIAIALAKKIDSIKITATDISNQALETAENNAKINEVNINLLISDIYENISGKFDLIVSNPPYIPKHDFEELPIVVKEYEPHSALFAEEKGLYYYNKILANAKEYLTKTGIIYFEIGHDQAEAIIKIASKYDFVNAAVYKDLNGYDRIIRISR